jgi:hypothetical protein
MAKKAPAKPPAKRKPRAKNRVDIAGEKLTKELTKSIAWRPWLVSGAKAVALIVAGAVAGVYAAGGIEVGPGPVVRNDVLQQSYDADRITQAAVLRELSEQDFDGGTDDGRRKAGEWFNAQRFRNRPADYKPYTDAVSEAIAADKVGWMADELEGK